MRANTSSLLFETRCHSDGSPPVIDGLEFQYANEFDWSSSQPTTGMHQLALAILTDYLTDGGEDEPENAC